MRVPLQLSHRQLAALRFEDVRSYLVGRGWKFDGAESPPDGGLYRFPGEADAEVLLPLRRDWPDYSHRMADVVLTLAAVEQRPYEEVLRDLASPPGDVLRLRVQAPDASLGTLPLEEGLTFLRGGRDLLLAAACSAHQPQPYYPRQSFAPALAFLNGCLIGQTERGSYVATIIAPVPPELTPSLFAQVEDGFALADEPYERRVTLHLMAALQLIRSALQSNAPERILEGVSTGISANLCEALASMSSSSPQSSVEVQMSWSRTRPRVPKNMPQRVTFAQGEFAAIREAGRRLREGWEPRRMRMEGLIVALQAEGSLLHQFQGRVILRTDVNGRSARISIVLGRDDYARACDAHRDHQRVAVTGLLHRGATQKGYELLQPREFQVLSQTIEVS
jgi:hypothetical protein